MPKAKKRETILSAATRAQKRGYSPVAIKSGKKQPLRTDWTKLRYSDNELKAEFGSEENVNLGLVLGQSSKGLVDIDLDCEEAIAVAPYYLTSTAMKHGRESSPNSHFWYILSDGNELSGYGIHKFVDPMMDRAKGSSLIEFRADGGQTLIPPSIHPSGEKYEWKDGEWGTPTEVNGESLMRDVRWVAAAALLIRYWPASGSRHEASLALAGGLLTLNDEELNYKSGGEEAADFVALVSHLAGDDEYEDRRTSVFTTVSRLERGKDAQGWTSLKKFIPPEVVYQVRDWLDEGVAVPDEEDKENHVSHKRLNLAVPVELHPELVPGLIYEGKLTWIQGEPGGGKTIFALWVIKELIHQKKKVVIVDEESGEKMTVNRLVSLGTDPKLAMKYLWYYDMPGLSVNDRVQLEKFIKEIDLIHPDLILFDSCADLLSAAGLSENDNDDFNQFYKCLLKPFHKKEYGVLVLDHVAKGHDVRGDWARGAGSKKSKADNAWTLTTTSPFSVNRVGRISLKRAKDRLGQMPNSQTFNIGGRASGTIVEKFEAVKELTSTSTYGGRIVDYLKDNGHTTVESAVNQSTIYKNVKGKREKLVEAMAELESNLGATPLEMVEEGNSKLWFYAGSLEVDFSD